MSNIITEFKHLSISSLGKNNHPSGSIISLDTMTQQSQPDNVESTTIPVPAPIRKWRWPKASERRKKAVTLDTNTNTLPRTQIPSEWIWENEIPQVPSWSTTPSCSCSCSSSQSQFLTAPDPSSPTLSLTEGFEKYWEDISDEEMTPYIPPNIVTIWKLIIAQKRKRAKAAGEACERALEEELDERYGAMLRYGEKSEARSVEGLLEMVEECDMFGWVKERGRRAFWKGNGVVRDGW